MTRDPMETRWDTVVLMLFYFGQTAGVEEGRARPPLAEDELYDDVDGEADHE